MCMSLVGTRGDSPDHDQRLRAIYSDANTIFRYCHEPARRVHERFERSGRDQGLRPTGSGAPRGLPLGLPPLLPL